jgi:hypothetical protein
MPDPDTDNFDRIDEHRMAHLDDVGLAGYDAAVVITAGGEERLVLASRDGLNRGQPYWLDFKKIAAHELTGRLPKAFAPTCGRRTSSGKSCRARVPVWGDVCSRHAAIESERSHA